MPNIFTFVSNLQKFRFGPYNVIVATTIGEEGVYIIEVDLLVAFDANMSPLRVIQRKGRTSIKHGGLVDILWFPKLLFGNCCCLE